MPTLLLVRHGETDWNRSGQIMGNRPIPLNDLGISQVRKLADFLKNRGIHGIFSSPVARTVQTARILSSTLDCPIVCESGLTEIHVGEWAGRFWTDLSGDSTKQNFYADPEHARPPAGETLAEVQRRAVAFVESLLITISAVAGQDYQVILVSHADVLRTIVAHYVQISLPAIRKVRIDHASLSILHIEQNLSDLICLNYSPNLSSTALFRNHL